MKIEIRMKKIYLYLTALVAAFCLAACSEDDTPQLSGVESGELRLDAGSIDGNNTKYTFTWTNTRFYLDGDHQKQVSLVGYEKNGVDYHLMGVETGRNWSEAVDFGSVVSGNHLTLDYEAIANVMQSNFGMVRSADEEKTSNIDFQLQAKYCSPDSCTVSSEILTVPFVLTVTPPFEGEKAKLFISIATDWSPSVYVYAWSSDKADTDLFGGWGGYKLEGSTTAGPDGNQYYEIPLNDNFYGTTANLIIHDEVNDGSNRVEGQPPLAITFADETEDVYLRVTGDAIDGYTVVRVEKPLPKLYVKSDLGYAAYAMYAWGGNGDVDLGWPGLLPTGTESINGENWIVFEPTKPYTQDKTNWIINNNGAGDQIDLMQGFEFTRNTFIRISADGSYTVAGGPIASDGYVVYIDDQTGWDEITCYQWGDVNDFGGGWPGKAVDGTVTIGGITYKYFNYGADVKGLNQNLIFNNGGNGVQIGDFNFTFERDLYLTVTADKATEK